MRSQNNKSSCAFQTADAIPVPPKPSGNKKYNIALYIRLSKEDGQETSNSVKHQRERLFAYLSHFEDEYNLIDVYIDDGFTGTDTRRENFQRMLRDIRAHRVNCVVVKDLSRLSRNVTDATYTLENLFIEYDVRFISLELPALDSYKHPEQMNSILVPIQNVINDDFCRQTSVKVRGVLNQKRRQGQFIGAFAPYGYAKDPGDRHRFVIDEEAAQVVRDIFNWHVKEGVSRGRIARRLNERGVPNPSAYKRMKGLRYVNPRAVAGDSLWNPKTVGEILRNQMYAGDMVQGRSRIKSYKVHTQVRTPSEEWYVVEGTHEALVGRALFLQAQKLREGGGRTPPGGKAVHVLSGFVRCPDCRKAMVRSQGGGKTKTAYYQCRTYREQSKTACVKHSIRADLLEQAVLCAVKAQMAKLTSPDTLAGEIKLAAETFGEVKRLSQAQEARERELHKTTALMDSLYGDWKNGDITKDDYHRLKAKYGEQADCLQSAIATLRAERQTAAENAGMPPYLQAFVDYHTIPWLERSTLTDLVDTVYVQADGTVEVVFNFQDPDWA